ncbi:LAME_0D03620g1_1 [Lachancea meyersii CBS 8951]|uniref:LAME_0D03620g1_1 n=1 Tax=Lachancea meyersii CBS 8951 TaxID=1266667 RepID=A0A1G4J7X7_9SACH|nr:LAME_0D03620g1_1 [Lachancea meyersii CBS 8951]
MVVSSAGLQHEIEFCIQEMERLKVTELKSVSRSVGLALSGRKADLQDRLRAYLNNSCRGNAIDPWRPKTILLLMDKARQNDALPTYETVWQELKSGALQHHPVVSGHQPPSSLGVTKHSTGPAVVQQIPKTRVAIQFSESPFYKLKRLLNGSPKFAPKNSGRGVCSYHFSLSREENALLRKGPEFKVFLFCGVLSPVLESRGPSPIQFPHPNDIRLNNEAVKDNVRGLKNKVGTAKPADLTPYLKPEAYENHLQLTYAFTKEDYLVYCYIVEVIPPQLIIEEVLRHPKIVKPATLQYLKESLSEDEDEDLVTTSTVMTLQCPISYCRMRYPSKSVHCRHLQCFDALWYIESQLQIPTWHCPVCQKTVKVEDLALCEFVEDIIEQCDDEVEQVEISRDGQWKPIFDDDTPAPREQSKVQVKSENGQKWGSGDGSMLDEDESGPSTGRRAVSQQADPVVISLDSDDEGPGPNSAVPPLQDSNIAPSSSSVSVVPPTTDQRNNDADVNSGNDSIRRDNTLGNIYGVYMDSNSDHPPSLDPRRANSTPSVNRHDTSAARSPGENSMPTSATFYHREFSVPNILGRTPLRNTSDTHEDRDDFNDNDARSDANVSPSPSGNASLGPKLSNPELRLPQRNGTTSMNNGSHNHAFSTNTNENVNDSSPFARYQPANFRDYHLPPLDQDRREGSNLLGLGGRASIIAPQDRNSAMPRDETLVNNENVGQQYQGREALDRGELNSAEVDSPTTTQGSGPVRTSKISSDLSSNSRRSPVPPPLPPAPQALNRTSLSTKPKEAPPLRHRKPIVSPFIPKKSYANVLPQKRQISSESTNKVSAPEVPVRSGQTTPFTDDTLSSVSPHPPILHRFDADELDFIDLTSDE